MGNAQHSEEIHGREQTRGSAPPLPHEQEMAMRPLPNQTTPHVDEDYSTTATTFAGSDSDDERDLMKARHKKSKKGNAADDDDDDRTLPTEDEELRFVKRMRRTERQTTLSNLRGTYGIERATEAESLLDPESRSEQAIEWVQKLWFGGIAEELQLRILGYLTCRDLGRFAQVSRECRALALTPQLWRDLSFSFCSVNLIDPYLSLPIDVVHDDASGQPTQSTNSHSTTSLPPFQPSASTPAPPPPTTSSSSSSSSHAALAPSSSSTALLSSAANAQSSSNPSLVLAPYSPQPLSSSSTSSLPYQSSDSPSRFASLVASSSTDAPHPAPASEPTGPKSEDFFEPSSIPDEVRQAVAPLMGGRIRRRLQRRRQEKMTAQSMVAATGGQGATEEDLEVDWVLVYRDLAQLPRRRQFHVLLCSLFKTAVLEYDQRLYRTTTLLFRCQVPGFLPSHQFSADILLVLRFFLPPLFPLKKMRPRLRIMSLRYLRDSMAIYSDYQLKYHTSFNGELKNEVAECIRQFIIAFRKYDHHDRMQQRGRVIGRKSTLMRCKPEKVLQATRAFSQHLTGEYLPFRYLSRHDSAYSHCFRFLTTSEQRESIVFFVDLHCELRMVGWNLQAEDYNWTTGPRFEVVRACIWHYVLAKANMNRFHQFALVTLTDRAELVQRFTDNVVRFGEALFRLLPAPPPAESMAPLQLTSVLQLMTDALSCVHKPTETAEVSSSIFSSESLSALRGILIYCRSNVKPKAPDGEVARRFYSLCTGIKQSTAVSFDVCFIHRPQRGALDEDDDDGGFDGGFDGGRGNIDDDDDNDNGRRGGRGGSRETMEQQRKQKQQQQKQKQKMQAPFPIEGTRKTLRQLTRPVNGYYWETEEDDALGFGAQLAVLLGHAAQRAAKQEMNASFGKVEADNPLLIERKKKK